MIRQNVNDLAKLASSEGGKPLQDSIIEINRGAEGVDAAVIVDGRVKHAVLLELFTDHGAGTLIR